MLPIITVVLCIALVMIPTSRTKIAVRSWNWVGGTGARLFIFGTSKANLTCEVLRRDVMTDNTDKKVVTQSDKRIPTIVQDGSVDCC